MEKDLISVIVPVYNVEAYLPRCLNTIIHQTYSHLEIILIDDGSTDSSGRICEEFAERDERVIVHHTGNQKIWAVRNRGLQLAKGNYIMFVDSDDYIHLDAIRIMHENILCNKYDLVKIGHKDTYTLWEDVENKYEYDITEHSADDLFKKIEQFGAVWGILFKKQLIAGVKFNKYEIYEDHDFSRRYFQLVNKAAWIHGELYFHFIREDSLSHMPHAAGIGCKAQIDQLVSILDEMPRNSRFRHYLLKDLYHYLIVAIAMKWSSWERRSTLKACQQIERSFFREYLFDSHFGLVEKISMILNVRHPGFIKWAKHVTRGHFSWHMLSKF